MSESAGKYSMMISGAAEPLAEALCASGMGRFVSGISGVPKGASLERALILHPADILVITDEAALSFAPTAHKKGCLAVLLLSDEDIDRRACVELGVFCCAWAQLHAAVHGGALKETVRLVLAHFEPGDEQQLCAVNEPRVV